MVNPSLGRLVGALLMSAFLLTCLASPAARATHLKSVLTEQERDWIAAHPVLRVGVLEKLVPIEYLSENKLRGISSKYLRVIEKQTGLHFEFVATTSRSTRKDMLITGEIDILSIRRRSNNSEENNGLLHTVPYDSSSAILISRLGDVPVTELRQMAGRTLVMFEREAYADYLREQAPGVNIIAAGDALGILDMVQDGRADAGISPERLVAPYLFRQFQGVLQITGVVPELSTNLSMVVRDDQTPLHSLLDKVLSSISADERKEIYDDWFTEMSLDIPTFTAIAEHYDGELVVLMVVALLLLALVWQSRLQRRQAMEREQEKAMFLAVMSHEIRSPMNAVLAAVELLEHTSLDEQQRHFSGLASAEAKTLLRLVDDVLEISRIDADQLKIHLEPVDLYMLVQKELDSHRLCSDEKGLELVLSGERTMPLLLQDAIRLSQVLHNLISNAVNFTQAGRVEVQLQLLEGARPNIRQLTIWVVDSGPGLSPQVLKPLFRSLARTLDPNQSLNGTGMGLMICRRLVRLMNGTLKFMSTPGGGTTVEWVMPVELVPLQDLPSERVVVQSMSTNIAVTPSAVRVLVVEESNIDRRWLGTQLEELGYDVLMANDAVQVLALHDQQRVDLVLMGCDAPDQKGYNLARDIRKVEQRLQRVHCPIIALSTFEGNEHLERCFDAGMDAVLGKPICLAKLQELIGLWCNVSVSQPLKSFRPKMRELSATHIELRTDLSQLLEAVVSDDLHGALLAAQRLSRVALALQWGAMAATAERLEQALRVQGEWRSAHITALLRALVEQCESPRVS